MKPSAAMQQVQLSRTKRLLAGHPWVFSNEIAGSIKGMEPGSAVEVTDLRGGFLGVGYVNPQSLIAVRILSRERQAIDRELIDRRLRAALSFRERFCPGRNGYRLVYSEGDGLPGLIVDRFDDVLVLQVTTAGMERLTPLVIDALESLLRPRTIVLRNDTQIRRLEGLGTTRAVVRGTLDPLPVIDEAGVGFEIDPANGQKTGFFLDQHDNRLRLARLVDAGRCLDLFCHTGAWALHAAAAGMEVIGVDASRTALSRARSNAERNGLTERVTWVEADVFEHLAHARAAGERYDAVVVDPPAFVKSKKKLAEALRAYEKLNAEVLPLVAAGGLVATSSCSYHLDRAAFLDVLRRAARTGGRSLRLLGMWGAGPDHPVPLAMPEAAYLKCALIEVR